METKFGLSRLEQQPATRGQRKNAGGPTSSGVGGAPGGGEGPPTGPPPSPRQGRPGSPAPLGLPQQAPEALVSQPGRWVGVAAELGILQALLRSSRRRTAPRSAAAAASAAFWRGPAPGLGMCALPAIREDLQGCSQGSEHPHLTPPHPRALPAASSPGLSPSPSLLQGRGHWRGISQHTIHPCG